VYTGDTESSFASILKEAEKGFYSRQQDPFQGSNLGFFPRKHTNQEGPFFQSFLKMSYIEHKKSEIDTIRAWYASTVVPQKMQRFQVTFATAKEGKTEESSRELKCRTIHAMMVILPLL
jgi:hypothetical protein